jgi:hypothetical protein
MKRRVDRLLKATIIANILAMMVVASALLVIWVQSLPVGHPAQSEAPPSSSPGELVPMGLAHIPTGSSCLLCHDTGGEAGLKPVPALGHPLEGWRDCVVCHTNDRLGQSAPGHQGIPQRECVNCHKIAPEGPAITQPHSRLQDQMCLDCHGDVAHLPSSMVGKNEEDCWLCHKPTASPPPQKPHPDTQRLTCRSCHSSPEVGRLPFDHALHDDSTCVLCHDIAVSNPANPAPTASPTASPVTPTQSPALTPAH